MAIPVSAIQAMLASKAALGPAPDQGVPMADPMAPAPNPFPSTDPTAVASALGPQFQALEQGDQMAFAQSQQVAAQGAMQMLLASMAAGPNPMAAAAQGGPALPVSDPSVGGPPSDLGSPSGY